MAAIHGEEDTSPQFTAGTLGLGGCSSTQQRHCSATRGHLFFPNISSFMCKADKSSKGLSYLQVLEKQLLDFKMGLNTNLFILFLNFSADADKDPDPAVPLQVTALQSWTQSRWAVAGDLSLRCRMSLHKSHCILRHLVQVWFLNWWHIFFREQAAFHHM